MRISRRRTSASAPTTTLRSRSPSFRFLTTKARLRKPRCAASGSASAASTTTGRCARATWRRSKSEHSTRGRAHLLWELLQGEVLRNSWKSEEVKESLDLCLSCKACKSECPTNVDIATYRAEFLAHYYETTRRPLSAYAFGMIDTWAGAGVYDAAPRQPDAEGAGSDASDQSCACGSRHSARCRSLRRRASRNGRAR